MIEKATGLFILLSTFIGTILLNSKLGHFFDVPSFLLVFLPLLILYFFKSLIKPSAMNDIQKGNELSHYELIGSTSLQLGLLGGILGFVLMFKNLNDPSAIGPAVAVTLLCMVYSLIGFLISFFMGNFKARPSYYYIPFLQLFFIISCFYIFQLSFKKV